MGRNKMRESTNSLTSRDFQDFGWETDRSLDAKLLVLGPVDKVRRNCIAVSSTSIIK